MRLDAEFKADCLVWKEFLLRQDSNKRILCQPFCDVTGQAEITQFYTDAAKGENLGMGVYWINTGSLLNGNLDT